MHGKIAVYEQMTHFVGKAMNLLDEQSFEELRSFVVSEQHLDGGFCDRGGRPDLYYSLFGMMIQKSGPQGPSKGYFGEGLASLDRLRQFVVHQSSIKVSGFIEQCCLSLLQKELRISRIARAGLLFRIFRSVWKERYSINLSYRSFVLFLTLDAVLPFSGILKKFSGKMLAKVQVDEHSPCSEIAARVFILNTRGRDHSAERKLLYSLVNESGGFKAFSHSSSADMLSTAVALFSLYSCGCDLRMIKPACLGFVEQNFSNGAFLSGDGDRVADLEYTFYGLLALGVLAY